MEKKPETEMMKVTISPAGSLSWIDIQRWLTNTLYFFQPVLILYLGYISDNLNNGFSWEAFIPSPYMLGVISKWLIDTLLDLLNKLRSEKRYTENGLKV